MKSGPSIRIVRKKVVHAAHHGGSWKVAYADFVTAMMAFFLVMWIISMDQPVKEDVQNYFNNPFSSAQSKAGISRLATGGQSPIAYGVAGAVNAKNWRQLAMEAQKDRFVQTQGILKEEFHQNTELKALSENVEVTVGDNGLLIELIEAQGSLFFKSGSAEIPTVTQKLLGVIAKEVGTLPNPVSIEGHTDTIQYPADAKYTNWELSADRANAARRVLNQYGLQRHQIVDVRGYADSRLRNPSDPSSYSNRRVSILVSYKLEKGASEIDTRSVGDNEKSPIALDLRPFSNQEPVPYTPTVKPK